MKKRSVITLFAICLVTTGCLVLSDRTSRARGWASSASSRAERVAPVATPAVTSTENPASAGLHLGTRVKSPLLDEASAIENLQKASSKMWDVRRDGHSNSIRTLARGLLVVPEGASVSASSDLFVKTYSKSIFGVDPSRLLMTRNETTDRTKIVYEEMIDGVSVYGATLTMFYENGALTRVQNDLPNAEPISGGAPAGFTLNQAFTVYQSSETNANVTMNASVPGKTILYPQGHQLYYAYQFVADEISKTDGSHSSYLILYDAENPHVIKRVSTQTH